ncbi:hypothetical protein [Humibacillus xanthopallidus]|uniref:hypothetical protein n=1 Tax=Humibacillus xanthopallidus TaxID=412689 RepID=UPI0038503675
MRAVVVVRGDVDERDIWPYAVMSESAGGRTTLTVTVHDSQELVGVLSSLAALGLEVISTHLIEQAGARASGPSPGPEEISSSEDDAVPSERDDSDQL